MTDATQEPGRDGDETVSLQLRLPEWLRADLTEAARANGRSLNKELVQRLVASTKPGPAATDNDLAMRLIAMAEQLLGKGPRS